MSILKKLLPVSLAAICLAGTTALAAWDGYSYSNSCNTSDDLPETGGAVLVDSADDRSPDGTAYIKSDEQANALVTPADGKSAENGDLIAQFEMGYYADGLSTPCTWEMDIRFDGSGAGFSPRTDKGAKNGKIDTTLFYNASDGYLHLSKLTGTKLFEASSDTWYHLILTGTYNGLSENKGEMTMTVYEYGSDGTLSSEPVYSGQVEKRNNQPPTRLVFQPNTSVDNVKISEIPPAAITLSADSELNVSAGSSIQFTGTVYADTEKTQQIEGTDITYELYDTNGEYLISDDVTITPQGGLLEISSAAESQSVVVRVSVDGMSEIYDEETVTISSVPMLELLGAGFNDDYTILKEVKLNLNYEFEGDMSFIAAIHDKDGLLKKVYFKNLKYADQTYGEITVNMNAELPSDFDSESDTLTVYAWSKTFD